MRQLTTDEKEAKTKAFIQLSKGEKYGGTIGAVWAFGDGFTAGLEYQDKRIEALEAIIKNALNEAYQSEIKDTGMEDIKIGSRGEYADKQDWLDSKLDEWKEVTK